MLKIRVLFFLLSFYFVCGNCLWAKSPCQIVYDAGSSGTRLFIYQKVNENWIEHKGPKTVALADPVRQVRGVKWSGRDQVVAKIVSSLDLMQDDFNWPKVCKVESVAVNGTAGMRLAEQKYPKKLKVLWQLLHQKLAQRFGKEVSIQTRTLTGFEEAVYAWIGLSTRLKSNDFGLIEIGGASLQLVYPCSDCSDAQKIFLNGREFDIVASSFLGLGIHEAYALFAHAKACNDNASEVIKNWKPQDCSNTLSIIKNQKIPDPYNYRMGKQNQKVPMLDSANMKLNWYIISNVRFSFARAYKNYINQKITAGKATIPPYESWTLGRVMCQSQNCLRYRERRVCRWLKDGCLES